MDTGNHADAGRAAQGRRKQTTLTIDTTSAPLGEKTVDERELATEDQRHALKSYAAADETAEQQTRCTRSAAHALPCESAARQTHREPGPPAVGGERRENWLPGLPGALYFPEFVGTALAQRVVAEVRACSDGDMSRGITKANGPRLRIWRRSEIDAGGLPAAIAELSRLLRGAQVLPEAEELMQVTVNQYGDPASATIVPHKDGRGERAVIVTILGGASMQFYYQPCCGFVPETQVLDPASLGPPSAAVLLQPRSCLTLTGESFTEWAHGIAPCTLDVADPSVANFSLTGAAAGARLPRSPRISVVFWTASPMPTRF